MRIGIVTVSDRVSRGEYEDRSGPAVVAALRERLTGSWEPETRRVPDDESAIGELLIELVDELDCPLVVTTGGTGPAKRDVTPEATERVCDRLLPGLGERMRAVSVATVPTAILSRQLAGLRGSSLILNLPGNPRAISQCLDAVVSVVPHAISQAGGETLELADPPELPH